MVVFIGPPGAGKSLQAELFSERESAKWLSVGKLLREKLTGEQHKKLDKGQLISDEIVTQLISDELATIDDKELVILDGFPRRDEQLGWLFTSKNPRKLDGVIVLNVDHEHIIERLLKRGRKDDKREIIESRIKIYYKEIQPILDHFNRLNVKIKEIDSNGTIEEVHTLIHEALVELGAERLN